MQPIAFFLHIPRTAGTTLNTILKNNFAPEEILTVYHKSEYEAHSAHSADELRRIRLIQGHLLLEKYDPPTMYGLPVKVFTFLREPVERLISEYAFLRSWPENHLYRYLADNKVSFSEYVSSGEKELYYRGKNFMTRCISGMDDRREYPTRALARAKMHLEKSFVFVGITERFTESLVLLADVLGLTNLLHEKRNALKKTAQPDISDDDRTLAEEFNRGDTELYRFAGELFEERIKSQGPAFKERVQKLQFINTKFQKISGLLMNRSSADQEGAILMPKQGKWK